MTSLNLSASITGSNNNDSVVVPYSNYSNIPLYVNLKDGYDYLQFDQNVDVTCYASYVEHISSSMGNLNLILETKALSEIMSANPTYFHFDFGGGYDTLTLGNFTNMLTVAQAELINGGTGSDSVYLSGEGNIVTLNNIEIIVGTSYQDLITLGTQFSSSISLTTMINLGAGIDTLNLGNFSNNGVVTGVEYLNGGTDLDRISLREVSSLTVIKDVEKIYLDSSTINKSFSLNSGELYLGNFDNSINVTGADLINGGSNKDTVYLSGNNVTLFNSVEYIYGGAGSDNVTLADWLTISSVINLGAGIDSLSLSFVNNTSNKGIISGVENLNGSSGFDDISFSSAAVVVIQDVEKITGSSSHDNLTFNSSYNNSLNLDKGTDKVILNGIDNSVNLFNTESLIGGAGKDVIVVKTQALKSYFDLKDGIDSLYFSNYTNTSSVSGVENINGGTGYDTLNFFGINISSVSSIENIIGGIGSDTITLKDQLTNKLTINLGNGLDTLNLNNFDINVGKVSGVEFINGGTGKDYITLTGSANTVTVKDVEFITGGDGVDKVTSLNSLTGTIDLGAGIDKLVLGGEGNSINISNVEQIAGSNKTDSIAFKTTVIDGIFDLKLGTDTIKFGDFDNSATFFNTEKIILGTGNDSITFGNDVTMETLFVGNSSGNDIVFNFDVNKDKIDLTSFSNISLNQVEKTVLSGTSVIGSYTDSTSDLVFHFGNDSLTLVGIDTFSSNFII